MIRTIYTLNPVSASRLESVVADMRTLGAPVIRVVDCGDHYMAIEGSHRMAACALLGIAPELDVLAQHELVSSDSLDWADMLQPAEQYTAGELAAEAYNPNQNGVYFVREDGTVEACVATR